MRGENLSLEEKVDSFTIYINEQRERIKDEGNWTEDTIDIAVGRFPDGAEVFSAFIQAFVKVNEDKGDNENITKISETRSLLHIVSSRYDYGCMEILLGRALAYIACNQWSDYHFTTIKPKEYLVNFMSNLELNPKSKIILLQTAVEAIKGDSVRGDHTLFIDGDFLDACGVSQEPSAIE